MLSGTPKRCSGCHESAYCGEVCQKRHWAVHIFDCKTDKPIGTVYYLARACLNKIPPLDAQTRVDYGFHKISYTLSGPAELDLLRLYTHVFHMVSLDVLRRWQRQGRLVQGIKSVFEGSPRAQDPAYTWFLQHESHFDDLTTFDADRAWEVAQDDVNTWLRAGWLHIGRSSNDSTDDIWAAIRAMPEREGTCLLFYFFALAGVVPAPWQEMWLTFGFVATTHGGREALGSAYRTLAHACAFDAFFTAHDAGALPALFREHGIAIPNTPCFDDVVSVPPGAALKTVWNLKRRIDVLMAALPGEPARQVLVAPAADVFAADYGYTNCQSEEETQLLDDLYTRVFTKLERPVDPLELHQASVERRLADYIGRFANLDERATDYARLLKTEERGVDAEVRGCLDAH
ncbi:uncharacterized protein BXZ73DRAFT_43915 [Epithele typhae]|uniref:uncharacterized protein n=1 Tax=Epithele typhae TaxID=378194 RepID=UPI002008D657|nr:uncharacterized protein BXZ73DRAFT_43915 [Epithele typhae]KAH9939361.1 hypothetical protein BXZ73DRAFT_43915 [Epithele typhae]